MNFSLAKNGRSLKSDLICRTDDHRYKSIKKDDFRYNWSYSCKESHFNEGSSCTQQVGFEVFLGGLGSLFFILELPWELKLQGAGG